MLGCVDKGGNWGISLVGRMLLGTQVLDFSGDGDKINTNGSWLTVW